MKIALVHDYLREYGGAERVVEVLHEMWPEAPLYTSFVDWNSFSRAPAGKVDLFKSWDIRTSPVADNWFFRKFHSPLRFLAPWIWNSFDLSGYDVVISSSGWFMCRGIKINQNNSEICDTRLEISEGRNKITNLETRTPKLPIHICYIHHPPRNLYGYATGSSLQKYWPVRVYATVVNFFLRKYDWDTAQWVDYFIANSKETARRVEKFYRRESTIIYPPVDVSSVKRQVSGKSKKNLIHDTLTPDTKKYFLSVGRLTYSKRVDVAIEACNQLQRPLKIVGSGKEEAYLRSIAGSTIEFAGSVSDTELATLYAGAKALLFCALDEDFGMVPVEAMAHGVPVIALAQGGVLETVVDPSTLPRNTRDRSGQAERATGVLFLEPTIESLVEAIQKFENNKTVLWEINCRKQAEKFSTRRFKTELISFVKKHYPAIGHSHR